MTRRPPNVFRKPQNPVGDFCLSIRNQTPQPFDLAGGFTAQTMRNAVAIAQPLHDVFAHLARILSQSRQRFQFSTLSVGPISPPQSLHAAVERVHGLGVG